MTLLAAFLEIAAGWRPVFPQQRTWQRAVRQSLGSLVCLGRRCLSRIIWTNGGQQRSWSAEYFLHSRCQWRPQQLFQPILEHALSYCPGRLVGIAVDDTRLHKTGRCIRQAFYQRDPLSPPFHVNLTLGLRFLQASLLVPTYRLAQVGTRGLPVRFEEVSRVKKPSRKAGPQDWERYKQAVKEHNLSRRFVEMMTQLRQSLDEAGGANKILVLAADGSFCNRTCLRARCQRTELIARARKDAVLCLAARKVRGVSMAPENSRRNKCARMRRGPGNRPRCFMAASGARSVIRRLQECIGKMAPGGVLCACWWWRPRLIGSAKAADYITGGPPFYSPRI
jgi:hypothetical protein